MLRRLAILTNIPAPYRLPMFRRLSESFDLRVIFDRRSEKNRAWAVPGDLGFPYAFAKTVTIPYNRKRPEAGFLDERYLQLNCGLFGALRDFQPEIIVSAELGLRSIQASLYSQLKRVPLIIWWEGTDHTEGWAPGYKSFVRRRVLARAERCWANGHESVQLLRRYGMEEKQIDPGLIGVDTTFFSSEAQRRLQDRDDFRRTLGLEGIAFIFVGQFVERKGVTQYLNALERLRSLTSRPFSAVFVGDGPQKSLLEEWAAKKPELNLRVFGFQQPSHLPTFFAASDTFVLPTLDDNWSLATLEAAVSGIPQIYSKFNGATYDLRMLGMDGACIDPYDREQFGSTLKDYVEHPPQRTDWSTIERVADFFSPEQCAQRATDSIEAAFDRVNRRQKEQEARQKARDSMRI